MIEVVRGGLVESRHSVRGAVADVAGGLVAWNGDTDIATFHPSTPKPHALDLASA